MKNFSSPKTKILILLSASIGILFGSVKADHQYGNFPALLNVGSLNGKNGFIIDAKSPSVSDAGDVNGDGIDDMIIANPFANNDTGQSYIVFGSKEPWSAIIDLSSLNGKNGFAINGIYLYSGYSVSGAGDINGDGVDDILIGEPNNLSIGHSYVVFGSKEPWSAIMDLSRLNGENGFIINGIHPNDRSGESVSRVGDVNGDGVDDIIIGGPLANKNTGQSYIVFGSKKPWSAAIDLSSLNGVNGFTINGIHPEDRSGESVKGAGDVNGDGIDDIMIGAQHANDKAGQSYIVFGNNRSWPAVINLVDLNGNNGFAINGINPWDGSGGSISGAGDVNGDGIDDMIIGARHQSYVVFGSKQIWSAVIDVANLNGGNGFTISDGVFVSGTGDVNGDGIDDMIIGTEEYQSYVVFGNKESWPPMIDPTKLHGINGFIINGTESNVVSGAGDVNDDGIDDIIIGDSFANDYTGQVYIIFGSFGTGPSDDNSLALGLGITGAIVGLGAISAGSYYGYQYCHRMDYTELK